MLVPGIPITVVDLLDRRLGSVAILFFKFLVLLECNHTLSSQRRSESSMIVLKYSGYDLSFSGWYDVGPVYFYWPDVDK